MYLGRIKDLNSFVALKQFEVIENKKVEEAIMEAVRKEMQLVKHLSHPNVIKFFTIHKSKLANVENGVQYNIPLYQLSGSV